MKAAIAQAVASAFKAVGDIAESWTLIHYTGAPVRSPVDGSYTRTSTSLPATIIWTELEVKKWLGAITGDRQLLMQQRSGALAIGDIFSGAIKYEVIEISEDPAHVTWIALVREKKITT